MLQKIVLTIILSLVLPILLESSEKIDLMQGNWSFSGPFGKFDHLSMQRGLKVFKEVCAVCHEVHRMPFRRLSEVGFSMNEVKAFASEFQIEDGPNDDGEMFDRPGVPSDYWPNVYKNEKQAMLANNGAIPPDLSLITKARAGGADYVFSLLQGYADAPKDFIVPEGSHYNLYMTGNVISMISPLHVPDLVSYDDGTKATISQMAHDVTNFLQWVAEPEMEKRKALGVKSIFFAILLTIFFYLSKQKVWKNLKK